MQKRSNTSIALTAAGVALVAGFFLPWFGHASGWDLVRNDHIALLQRLLFALCPLLGAGLVASSIVGSRRTALIAVGAGLGVLGYTGYKVADVFLAITGWGLWVVLGGAALALVVGLARKSSV
ncbi:MAG TPA: hypothetical protein VL172_10275 [Kofleriaceae bacterium]|jgi:hypothetical protein|nr:hypothetical protein [Kofleriaceae bacterium]